jgi:hypothetical protein
VIASFAGESKDAQEALLVLQQTLAVIDAIQQASDALRLARQAQKIAAIKAETVATSENTAATVANAQAQSAVGAGLSGATKGVGSLGNAFSVLGNVIKANPIIAIASVLALVGAGAVALSRKFKPLGDAVNFVSDTFGGVSGAIKSAVNNFDTISDTVSKFIDLALSALNPINNIKRALNFAGICGV